MYIKYNMERGVTNINFTGRCPQIRKAQWVCHTVSTKLPHTSPTNFTPIFDKFMVPDMTDPRRNLSISARKNLWYKLDKARVTYQELLTNGIESVLGNLEQLKNAKIGNCGEIAAATEIVLRANGIKNASRAILKCGEFNVDHAVCVFNRDGSEFNKVINNKTIIVDAWNGMVDFAGNMFKTYKNMYRKYFYFPQNNKFSIGDTGRFNLTETDMENILKQFPEIKQRAL